MTQRREDLVVTAEVMTTVAIQNTELVITEEGGEYKLYWLYTEQDMLPLVFPTLHEALSRLTWIVKRDWARLNRIHFCPECSRLGLDHAVDCSYT